jgi:succinate dehydrogenase / fumarate reductase membrane anchor subunit
MINEQTAPKSEEGVWLWLAKIVTGLLIFVILAIHFVVNHFLPPNRLLSYADVVRYYQNPIILIMEGLFLVFVISHSLIGLRGIILDLHPERSVLRAIDVVFVVFGGAFMIYGIWLLVAVAAQPIG